MHDQAGGQSQSGSKNTSDIVFTVPEKTPDVRVTDTPAHPSSGNHDKELFDVGRAFSGDGVEKGTIVSDRKRSRMGVGRMLVSAWNEWWEKTQQSVEQSLEKIESHPLVSKKEEPKVAPAETRTEVIREAASVSVQAPRDDHALVKEKIRSEERIVVEPLSKFAIQPEKRPEQPTWLSAKAPEPVPQPTASKVLPPTLNLQTGGPVVNPNQSPVFPRTTEMVKKPETLDLREREEKRGWSHYTDTKETKPAVPRVTPTPTPLPQYRETRIPSPPPPLPKPEHIVVPPPAPQKESTPLVRPTPPPQSESRMQPIVARPQQEDTREEPVPPPTREKPLREHFILRIPKPLLLSVVVLVGVSAGVFLALTRTNTEPRQAGEVSRTTPTSSSFLIFETHTPISFTGEGNTLLLTLGGMVMKGGEQSETIALITEGAESHEATVTEFMDAVGKGAPGTLTRALLPEYRLGILREGTSAPFIVLSSPEYERSFGGMLAWESSMSADLSPFFGGPVTETLPPRAERVETTPRFVDALRHGVALRILFDGQGNERIVYALVHKKYIVITTTTEALASLITRLP